MEIQINFLCMCRFTNKKRPKPHPLFLPYAMEQIQRALQAAHGLRKALRAQASHVSALRHCRPVWSMYVSSFVSRSLEIGTIS